MAEVLPEWNTKDLYSSVTDEKLFSDLTEAERAALAFETRYKGCLRVLADDAFGAAVSEYERINELLAKISAYFYLRYSEDVTDADIQHAFQNLREKSAEIATHLLFFVLDLNRLEDSEIAEKLKFPSARRYETWLKQVRRFRPHQLDSLMEQFIAEKEAVFAGWNRLYDETLAKIRVDWEGAPLNLTAALEKLSDPSEDVRKTAAAGISTELDARKNTLALVLNTQAKDKQIEDKFRKYPRPVSAMNLANQVEDEIVDTLAGAVRGAYGTLSHRYYRLKARVLGKEVLSHWDRNAPWPAAEEKKYAFEEAKAVVLAAYREFSPEMAEIGERFFEKNWISATPGPNKMGGAYSHGVTPSAHPYIMLNYMGRTRDVMTLAHELGHGIHQVLSARQGFLLAHAPLTFAETASVFGEMCTFQSLLKRTSAPAEKQSLIAHKIEDMLNTVVRQIAFHTFETRFHEARRGGELSAAQIGDIWMEVQKESLGPAFEFSDDYRVYWSYIHHFAHSPFYVYAYAFADCVVNSLYELYLEAKTAEQKEEFVKKYIDLLSAGGARTHHEFLAPFGLSAADPAFWNKGLSFIGSLIDQLEESL